MSKELLLLIAVFLAGAVFGAILKSYLGAPALPRNVFGKFIGQVKAVFDDDGRTMQLNEDFAYKDPSNKVWLAPAGSVIDGASIPKPLWSLIGGPFEGQYRNASVIHDVACVERSEPSDAVHRMFYFACVCGGVNERKAKLMYYAVAHFGPSWKMVYALSTKDGWSTKTAKSVDVVEGREPTTEEVAAMVQYFETNNPRLDEIPNLEIGP